MSSKAGQARFGWRLANARRAFTFSMSPSLGGNSGESHCRGTVTSSGVRNWRSAPEDETMTSSSRHSIWNRWFHGSSNSCPGPSVPSASNCSSVGHASEVLLPRRDSAAVRMTRAIVCARSRGVSGYEHVEATARNQTEAAPATSTSTAATIARLFTTEHRQRRTAYSGSVAWRLDA